MRKWKCFAVPALCLVLLTAVGCEKNAGKAVEAPQSDWNTYELGREIDAYTLDGEGNLYTIESDSAYPNLLTDPDCDQKLDLTRWLRKYDAEGNQLFSTFLGENFAGTGTMAYLDGTLYFPNLEERETGGVWPAIFAADAETGELIGAAELPLSKLGSRVVSAGERLYLLAEDIIWEYDPGTEKFAELKTGGAIDLAATQEGNLLIYAANEEGYAFLLYRIKDGAIKTLATLSEDIANAIAAGPTEDSVIYIDRSNLLIQPVVYAEFSDMGNTTEIYPQAMAGKSFATVNGRLVLKIQKAGKDGIVTMELDRIRTGQREIRYLTQDDATEDPYGCGFTITRDRLAADKLVLKLLAQDTDFDMIHVNSMFSPLSGVRDSGCFYPLNEVPGVEEYLDCCFPYVRDAVTDEDGNIWILPVNIDMEVLVCNTKRCSEQGYAFKDNMTYEEFFAAYGALSEEERELTASLSFPMDFLDSYFYGHTSVDTAEFRQTMKRIKQIMPLLPKGGGVNQVLSGEYIYKTSGWDNLVEEDDVAIRMFGCDARAYALPKMDRNAKNVATCRGFVVNPRSDNLEQTLQYVATFVAYQMGRKNAPVFFAVPENREDSYRGSLYRVYENGAVFLGVEGSLYWDCIDYLYGEKDLEECIAETEKKLRIYFGE